MKEVLSILPFAIQPSPWSGGSGMNSDKSKSRPDFVSLQ
jgi:hypothetical protein